MISQKSVLVVEDDTLLADSLRSYFESLGCIVDMAQSYISGKDMLDDNQYALVVSDNRMPISKERNPYPNAGIELLAYAKADPRHDHTPMVLHTADDSEQIRKGAAVVGVHFAVKGSRETYALLEKLLKEA